MTRRLRWLPWVCGVVVAPIVTVNIMLWMADRSGDDWNSLNIGMASFLAGLATTMFCAYRALTVYLEGNVE